MNSSRFNLKITGYAILIGLTAFAFLWAVNQENKFVTSISLGVLWIVELIWLIRYVNTTNRNLLLFLQSFRFDDSSLVFNVKNRLPFPPIYREFNRIIDQFRRLRIEREVEHQYFEELIRHVDTGLIAYDHKGNVDLMNRAARDLLKTPHLKTLEGLKFVQDGLPDRIRNLRPGLTEVLKILAGNEIRQLYLRTSEFNLDNRNIRLVSFQNIRPELEQNEAEAWQRLIKVLTHEIVNSVSPINLVSSSLMKMVEKEQLEDNSGQLTQKEIDDLRMGLKAIRNRSLGLSKFVDDYKTITEIPKPDLENVQVKELIDYVITLLRKSFLKENIVIRVSIEPENLTIRMDRKMVEQILINLLKNASRALEEHPEAVISISGDQKTGRGRISVTDNGCGIPFNFQDYIFMPFFTTKKDGSGIGLTLSRQLMKAQNGQISIQSREGIGTEVNLIFN